MERIFETLPAAKKWAFIMGIISAITFVFNLLALIFSSSFGGGVLELVMQGFLMYFLFAYYQACSASIEDESAESLEKACRQQKNIFVVYGVQAAFLLITLAVAIFYVIVVVASVVSNSSAL